MIPAPWQIYIFLAIAAAVVIGLAIETARFRRAMRKQVIVCECGHGQPSHKLGSCSECNCFLWYPQIREVKT